MYDMWPTLSNLCRMARTGTNGSSVKHDGINAGMDGMAPAAGCAEKLKSYFPLGLEEISKVITVRVYLACFYEVGTATIEVFVYGTVAILS